MKHRNTINICAVLIGCFLVCAVMAEPITVTPQYEQRYSSILGELRCLVCQNQTIAESNADLAIDLRVEVKNMLEKGATDSEIIDFMANRYGDFILYRPQLKPRTYPLWFGPFLLLAVVLLLLYFVVNRQSKDSNVKLTDEEKTQLNSILNQTEEKYTDD